MSDVMPNLILNRARLDLQRQEHVLNINRMKVRILEMEDETARIRMNMAETEKEVNRLADVLAQSDDAPKGQVK